MREILAPAGSLESAYAAINAGADAIYLGMKAFSARSSAGLSDDNFIKVMQYAHAFGVKVHVALNTFIKEDELEDFLNDALYCWNCGADALILQDIWLGAYIHERFPQITLHLSTQAGVCNVYGARLAKRMGFSRVIVARETPLEDIREIASVIETECFVQGALCTCFSGQCYLSSFIGGYSGNRGRCKQPCRKKYTISRPGYEEESYKLSLADLCVGEDIGKLIDAGVSSFKIEGRLRRPEYVSAAVHYYRSILDGASAAEVEKRFHDMARTYNRGDYTKGLGFGPQPKDFISSQVQGHMGEYVGTIHISLYGRHAGYECIADTKGKARTASARTASSKPDGKTDGADSGKVSAGKDEYEFSAGDGFKIFRRGKDGLREVGGGAFSGKTEKGCKISSNSVLRDGDLDYITTDASLNEHLLSEKRLLDTEISAYFFAGSKAKVVINGREYFSDEVLQPAVKQPLKAADIEACFMKTDTMPFDVRFDDVATDNVFIAKSALNEFRRQVYSRYYNDISSVNDSSSVNDISSVKREEMSCDDWGLRNRKTQQETFKDASKYADKKAEKTAVICGHQNVNYDDIYADIIIVKPADYTNSDFCGLKDKSKESYLYLPAYMPEKELKIVKPLIGRFDGIFCEGTYGIELAKELGVKLFTGPGFNVTNSIAVAALEKEAEHITLSKELTTAEQAKIATEKTFCLTAGRIKVMDLVYCPFGRNCATCDKAPMYFLDDEEGRIFWMDRYKIADCHFEIFNCKDLAAYEGDGSKLYDLTFYDAPQVSGYIHSGKKPSEIFKNYYTRGHSDKRTL